jgi:hypothetical protein
MSLKQRNSQHARGTFRYIQTAFIYSTALQPVRLSERHVIAEPAVHHSLPLQTSGYFFCNYYLHLDKAAMDMFKWKLYDVA